MNNNLRCYICMNRLPDDTSNYHSTCIKKFFGLLRIPAIPYSRSQINELAKKTIIEHITIPGVQVKLSMHLERTGRNQSPRLTIVGFEGGYILKPPSEKYLEMPQLEHLTMHLASIFEIATAESGLIPLENGQLAYITKRMDRSRNSKIHMEDMCQLTDRLTEQKYRGSLEQVGKVILRHCSNSLLDALRFFELILFCYLTGNADMHLKNFSLIYKPNGEIGLAPAYDLLPTSLLIPEDNEESALTLNRKKRRLNKDDFEIFAQSLFLNEKQIINVFNRFSAKMNEALLFLEKGFYSPEIREKYIDLIKQRSARLELSIE